MPSDAAASHDATEAGPRVARRAGLPSVRSLVGGLLVAVAALGTIAVARDDAPTSPPLRLVATRSIGPGEILGRDDVALGPVALPGRDDHLFEHPDDVEGLVALGPLATGDPLVRSLVRTQPAAEALGHHLTVPLPRARAVGGTLVPGERVDVLVTFGTGADATTERVAAGAPVVRLDTSDGLGTEGDQWITLAVPDDERARALAHAAAAGTLTLVRVTSPPDAGATTRGDAPDGTDPPRPAP